jgi:TolB-like protein/DNA-binding winged helix-turn-helix (wHTH) protein/cytochrome c-type biogenesis protein CcmH/NrfG
MITFGDFEVKLGTRELCRKGIRVRLPDQSFQILAMLLERPGELVTREEIQKRLWPGDTFVDFDHGLNNAVNRLREALRDSADKPRFVETLPRRGYRFIDPVETGSQPIANLPAESLTSVERVGRYSRRQLAALAFVSGVVLLAFLAIGPLRFRTLGNTSRITSLAVLPLVNVSGDADQDYFADGMTDTLITDLAGISSVRVISRTSAMHYKGSQKSLPEITRELDVDAIVEGTVSKSGNRVRINAQLVDARKDRHLWAAAYERDLGDVLTLQAELADAIAKQVDRQVNPQRRLLSSDKRVNTEAYEAYLRGRYEASQGPFTREGEEKAREYFNRAIQLEPDNADAIVGLAETYIPADPATARLLASKALELDGGSAEAHAIVATVTYTKDWSFAAAEQEFRLALDLDPNCVAARSWYGIFLAQTGHFDDALRMLQMARRLDPLSPTIGSDLGEALFLAHRYDEAIDQELTVLRRYPNYQRAYRHLMRMYERLDRIPEAITAFTKAPGWYDLTPDQAEIVGKKWRAAYTKGGAPAYWRERLAFELPRKTKAVGHYYGLARVYTQLGDSDHAIATLQDAYDHRDPMLVALVKTDPQLDNLRSDPRFQGLLNKVGFPQ